MFTFHFICCTKNSYMQRGMDKLSYYCTWLLHRSCLYYHITNLHNYEVFHVATAETISAAEAYRIGLINKVVPQAELMNEVQRLLSTLLERGPLALRAAKQAMIQSLSLPLDEGMQLEQRLFRQLLGTEDAIEGPKAFAEKRKPNFKGK